MAARRMAPEEPPLQLRPDGVAFPPTPYADAALGVRDAATTRLRPACFAA